MAPDPSFWLHPAVWAAASFLVVFLAAGLLLLDRPRKWWFLVAAAVAAFILFDISGLLGFLAAFALRLWRAHAVLKKEASDKKDAARGRPVRQSKHRKSG